MTDNHTPPNTDLHTNIETCTQKQFQRDSGATGDEQPQIPELFTEEEVADKLRVSTDTIAREREDGNLGFISVRRRVLITAKQLSDYINKGGSRDCRQGSSNTTASG